MKISDYLKLPQMGSKKGAVSETALLVIAVLAIAYFGGFLGGTQSSVSTPQGTGITTGVQACKLGGGVSTTSFTAQGYGYNPIESGTLVTVTYSGQISDRFLSAQAGGTAVNVAPGGSFSAVGTAANRLGSQFTGTLGADAAGYCVGSAQSAVRMPADGGVTTALFAQNGTAGCEDFTGTREKRNSYATVSSNETWAYLSHPEINKVLLVITANDTVFDEGQTTPTLGSGSCARYTGSVPSSVTNTQRMFFECSGNVGAGIGTQNLVLSVQSDSDSTPSSINTTAGYRLYPYVYFRDPESGQNVIKQGAVYSNGTFVQPDQALVATYTICS